MNKDNGLTPWNLDWYNPNHYQAFYEEPIKMSDINPELAQDALIGVPTEPMDPEMLRQHIEDETTDDEGKLMFLPEDVLFDDDDHWDLDGVDPSELLG